MRVIALTGSAASGKSTVGALFREWGTPVIDADVLVRDLQRPGQPVHRAIADEFGPDIVGADGEIDRPRLRRVVLRDVVARRRLESLVHPAVERRRVELLAAAAARGERLVIAEIPLLFEAADPAAYHGIIVIDAPLAERRRRLIDDRGMSPREADQLIAAQLPAEAKRLRATWIIDNDADRATLAERSRRLWETLQS
ncbi:MAG: dephospho-CoA kinase [Gemmatimonadales bacterium]